MGNPRFGTIGDVWKHLPLGDMLDRLRPSRYWETHAGSATYALDRSWEREYGIFTLLREASRAPAIDASRYVGLVRTLTLGADGEPRYPGSSRLAMEVLGGAATYQLCELDPGSVSDLTRTARALDLVDLVRVEHADGLATIWTRAADVTIDEASSTFVLIDPRDAAERSADGVDALDLFARLAVGGFQTLLWHGYDEAVERDAVRARGKIDGVPTRYLDVETALVRGDTMLDPGVGGCGLLVSNVPDEVVDHIERLGRQLEACYEEALMPDGTPGNLRFTRSDLG